MSRVKFLMLIWRRPGLSHAEFRHYYETRHALLGASALPAAADYRRNYPLSGASAALGGFDVITEVWHASQAAFDAQIAARQKQPAKDRLDADEARFMDRDRKVFVMLSEQRPEIPDRGVARRKLLRFNRAPTGMAPQEFQAAHRALMQEAAVGEVAGYRCNFVTGMTPAEPAVDLIDEIWLDDAATTDAWPQVPGAEAFMVPVVECGLADAGAMAPLASSA